MNGSVTIEGDELLWRAGGKIIRQRANHFLRGQWLVDVPRERRRSLYDEIEARFPGWVPWDTPPPPQLEPFAKVMTGRNSRDLEAALGHWGASPPHEWIPAEGLMGDGRDPWLIAQLRWMVETWGVDVQRWIVQHLRAIPEERAAIEAWAQRQFNADILFYSTMISRLIQGNEDDHAWLIELVKGRGGDTTWMLAEMGQREIVIPSLIQFAESQPLSDEGRFWIKRLRRRKRGHTS